MDIKVKNKDIFLIYNYMDIKDIEEINDILGQNGFKTILLPYELFTEEDCSEIINKYLNENNIVIAFISENSLSSPWSLREILQGLTNNTFISYQLSSTEVSNDFSLILDRSYIVKGYEDPKSISKLIEIIKMINIFKN